MVCLYGGSLACGNANWLLEGSQGPERTTSLCWWKRSKSGV